MLRSFFRNAGILSAVQILVALKGVVLLPLLTHKFGAVNYGAWAQVSILVGLLPPVIVLGTDSAVVRFLPGRDHEHQLRAFSGWVLSIAALGTTVCLVLALARGPVATVFFGHSGPYARLVPLAAADIWATLLVYAAQTWFRVRNDAPRLALIALAQAVASLLGTVIMLVAHQGVYQLVLYMLVGDLLIAGWMLYRIVRHQRLRPDFSPLGRYVRFGLPLLPAGYAVWALNWLDRVFLISYRTLADVGIYSAAYSLAYMIFQTVVNPIYAMYPNLASEKYNVGDQGSVQRLFERTAGAILIVVAPAIAGSAVLGTDLLRVLTPKSFAGAAPVVPIVMAGYLCFMLAAYYETTFGLILKPKLSTIPIVIAFAINIGLNFLLIPPYGYIGAAVATGLAFVVQLTVAMVMVQRTGHLITPIGYVIRALMAAGLMALSLEGLLQLVHPGTVGNLLVGIPFGLLVYVGLCFLLRLVPPDALTFAAGLLRSPRLRFGRFRGDPTDPILASRALPGRDGE